MLMRNCDADAKMMGRRIDLRGGRVRADKQRFRCWFALHSCSEASSCRQGTVSPCGEAGRMQQVREGAVLGFGGGVPTEGVMRMHI